MNVSMVFFWLGFFILVTSVFIFLNSDASAFKKVQKQLDAMKIEHELEINGLHSKLDQFHVEHEKLMNQVGGLELEVKRIKEKMMKINLRLIPQTKNINLKISNDPKKPVKKIPKSAI